MHRWRVEQRYMVEQHVKGRLARIDHRVSYLCLKCGESKDILEKTEHVGGLIL